MCGNSRIEGPAPSPCLPPPPTTGERDDIDGDGISRLVADSAGKYPPLPQVSPTWLGARPNTQFLSPSGASRLSQDRQTARELPPPTAARFWEM